MDSKTTMWWIGVGSMNRYEKVVMYGLLILLPIGSSNVFAQSHQQPKTSKTAGTARSVAPIGVTVKLRNTAETDIPYAICSRTPDSGWSEWQEGMTLAAGQSATLFNSKASEIAISYRHVNPTTFVIGGDVMRQFTIRGPNAEVAFSNDSGWPYNIVARSKSGEWLVKPDGGPAPKSWEETMQAIQSKMDASRTKPGMSSGAENAAGTNALSWQGAIQLLPTVREFFPAEIGISFDSATRNIEIAYHGHNKISGVGNRIGMTLPDGYDGTSVVGIVRKCTITPTEFFIDIGYEGTVYDPDDIIGPPDRGTMAGWIQIHGKRRGDDFEVRVLDRLRYRMKFTALHGGPYSDVHVGWQGSGILTRNEK
jgi:hypothetical protein